MDRYIFWIVFTSIIMFTLISLSIIIGLAWVNSPTIFSFEFGLDDESLTVLNSSSFLDGMSNISESLKEYGSNINEIQQHT